MLNNETLQRTLVVARRFVRGLDRIAPTFSFVYVLCLLGFAVTPGFAAPILLAEFKARDVAVLAGSTPATIPFDFKAYEEGQFPTPVYFEWQQQYGPSDIGTTFTASPEIVDGAENAIRSPTATYELAMALVKFTTWQLPQPSCDANKCLQLFVPNIADHNVTSVERIIDQLTLTGNPPGAQYVVDGTQRIRLWGEPIPEPSTISLLATGICAPLIFLSFRRMGTE